MAIEYKGPIAFAKELIQADEILYSSPSPAFTQSCEGRGFTSFSVPFWWDREKGSLLSSLLRHRIDLFQNGSIASHYQELALNSEPIPDSISREDLYLNPSRLEIWKRDPRFEHITASPKPLTKKISEKLKKNPWESLESQRDFLFGLGPKLGITHRNDFKGWYKISTKDIIKYGGRLLLHNYSDSVSQLLSKVFPEHPWDESLFEKKPQNFWHNLENQRNFFIDLALKLNFSEDKNNFYKFSTKDVVKNGGSGLLEVFNKSVSSAVMVAFPEHEWHLWKFNRSRSQKKWREIDSLKSLVNTVETHFGVTDREGWYNISRQHLKELDIDQIIRNGSELAKLLGLVYPDHPWDFDKLSRKS